MELVREIRGGEPYEYYPLGEYVVMAPGVCGGRPTFKGTRIEVGPVLEMLATESVEEVVRGYRGRITQEAIAEALHLASQAIAEWRPAA